MMKKKKRNEDEKWKKEEEKKIACEKSNKFTQIVYILWIYLELFESALPESLSDTKNAKSAPSSHLRADGCGIDQGEIIVMRDSFVYRYVSYWEIEKDEMSYFTFCDFNGFNVLMLPNTTADNNNGNLNNPVGVRSIRFILS